MKNRENDLTFGVKEIKISHRFIFDRQHCPPYAPLKSPVQTKHSAMINTQGKKHFEIKLFIQVKFFCVF